MRKGLLGIPIDWIEQDELLQLLQQFVLTKNAHQITTVNGEFVVIAHENDQFKHILKESDLSLPDGTGLVLGQTLSDMKIGNRLQRFLTFFLLGLRHILLPQTFTYKRITGVDLVHYLLQLGSEHRWRFFLLGAKSGVAQKAGELWQKMYPGIILQGTSADNPDSPTILASIRKAQPDVLLVAYGAPKQDIFIAKHKVELNVPIMAGVGGTFDYAVGNVFRPPRFIRLVGLEWLVRLFQQPRRLPRIYRSTVVFLALLIKK